MGKELVIGAFRGYKWPQIRCWVNSVAMSGFAGDKVAIIEGDTDDETKVNLNKKGFAFAVVPTMEGIAPHVSRFFWLWKFLDENPDFNRVWWSDVRDVVYQENPSDWKDRLLNREFLVQSESLTYEHEPWGKENFTQCFGPFFYEKFKSNPIYNVGNFAGSMIMTRDLALQIFQFSLNRPIKIVDQAVFNFLLDSFVYRKNIVTHTAYAAILGTRMDPAKIEGFRPHLLDPEPIIRDNVVCTPEGNPFLIAHQYDRVPGLREAIEAKYGND